jgi:FkbM family methyltransferase
MQDDLKRAMYGLLRPLHSPFTRALRRRLGRNYFNHPEMELPPPYEAVQLDVERHLHDYLHAKEGDISQIIIVGAFEADEVERLRLRYPAASFLCFEPNPDTFSRLSGRLKGVSHVSLRKLALSDAPGKTRFYELSMQGNGSLLPPDLESWASTLRLKEKSMASFEVEVSTLDREAAKLPVIDLLWMDVQGAEGHVLSGGAETLKRTKAVFLEVALVHSPYKGAQLFPELHATLQSFGFMCVGLGVDAWNGFGNAFFIKQYDQLVCK